MSVYTDHIDYLALAEVHGLDYDTVYALYQVLGDEEAFDGLVIACIDAEMMSEAA